MRVGIVIPCLNEENYIGKCLESIVKCTFSKDLLSVYVCDGFSTDGTRNIVSKYGLQYDFIHMLDNIEKSTPFALNLGLRASKDDVKIILGAHSEIYPDYIEKCLEAFAVNKDIGCVGGIIENVFTDKKSASISSAMSSFFGVGSAHFRTGLKEGYVDTVAFGAYKKEVFEKVGYFDDDLVRNQDDEFNYRINKAGFKIYLSKKIKSKYYVRASFKKLFKQYYQYGYWKVFVNVKHNTITTLRQLVPAAFVSFLGLSILIAIWNFEFFIYTLPIYFIYAILALFAAIKCSKNIQNIYQIMVSFFILHFSYGIGYWEGFMHFIILNKKPISRLKNLSR
jgi:glycosyltransferase involved in cell wall biosynthesis